MTIEQRTVENLVPVGLSLTIQQQIDGMIALAIERREEEDERTQDETANEQPDVWFVLETCKHILTGIHGTDEIERHKSTRDAQQNTGRYTLNRPVRVKMEREHHRIA